MQFNEFYMSWYSRAIGFARHYVSTDADAENMVQDVFLQLYEHWSALDGTMNKGGKTKSVNTIFDKMRVD